MLPVLAGHTRRLHSCAHYPPLSCQRTLTGNPLRSCPRTHTLLTQCHTPPLPYALVPESVLLSHNPTQPPRPRALLQISHSCHIFPRRGHPPPCRRIPAGAPTREASSKARQTVNQRSLWRSSLRSRTRRSKPCSPKLGRGDASLIMFLGHGKSCLLACTCRLCACCVKRWHC